MCPVTAVVPQVKNNDGYFLYEHILKFEISSDYNMTFHHNDMSSIVVSGLLRIHHVLTDCKIKSLVNCN